MLAILKAILDEALQLASYVATPVHEGRTLSDDARIADLRLRADALRPRLQEGLNHLAAVIPGTDPPSWSLAEQALFGVWLTRAYPHEASAGVIALGDAWKEGNRIGSANLERYREMHAQAVRDLSQVRLALGPNDDLAGRSELLVEEINALRKAGGEPQSHIQPARSFRR